MADESGSRGVLAKAWIDPEFRKRLIREPVGVLRENGIPIPNGVEVRVVENTADTRFLVVTPEPGEISPEHEELHRRHGGKRHFGIFPGTYVGDVTGTNETFPVGNNKSPKVKKTKGRSDYDRM